MILLRPIFILAIDITGNLADFVSHAAQPPVPSLLIR